MNINFGYIVFLSPVGFFFFCTYKFLQIKKKLKIPLSRIADVLKHTQLMAKKYGPNSAESTGFYLSHIYVFLLKMLLSSFFLVSPPPFVVRIPTVLIVAYL